MHVGTPAVNGLNAYTEPLFIHTGSPAAYRFVGHCLEECVSFHKECAKTVSGKVYADEIEPELPRRVIDVLPRLGGDSVCLFESHSSRGRYTVLSHCWGPWTMRPLETTIDTLSERLAGIEMESLPQTFQDAVYVTRAAGLRFLWIDSLCIVQDDATDKVQQLGQMGAFYEKASFTIAAADAANSRQGLFRSLSQEAVTIPYHDQSGKPVGLISVRSPEPPSRLEGSPLATRAWVTQEMILSRRVVAYTRYGILWSCKSGNKTEMGKSLGAAYIERSADWNQVISLYTARQLSYQADKLAALEGIVTSLKEKTGDRCFAGVWEREMPGALLWSIKVHDWEAAERLPSELNLPSWSWASVNCVVHPRLPGGWYLMAQAACGNVGILQTEGGLQLQVEGLLTPAPDSVVEMDKTASDTNARWALPKLDLGRGKAPHNHKKELQVPANQVEMPNSLFYRFQEEESGKYHVIGWSLLDVRHDIISDAFVLRLMSRDQDEGRYNFVLLLRRCENEVEVHRRIGMGIIFDPKNGNVGGWFRKAKQRQVRII